MTRRNKYDYYSKNIFKKNIIDSIQKHDYNNITKVKKNFIRTRKRLNSLRY